MGRPKRKETSGSPVKEDPSKRRRQTSTPAFDFSEDHSIAEFGRFVLSQINQAKDSRRGVLIAQDFQTAPSKVDLPQYYEVIRNPIALDSIEAKLDDYKSVDELLEDFKLMESNALTFNQAKSPISQYAIRIRGIVEQQMKIRDDKLQERAMSQISDDGSVYARARDVLLSILDDLCDRNITKDGSGKFAAGDLFRDPVSAKDYPDYYRIIKRPIALEMIRKKLNTKDYSQDSVVDEFEDDMFLLLDNAAEYNEPDSEVMGDAKIIQSAFVPRMATERKKLGLPARSLPPKDRYYNREIKKEDVVMKNGIESGPRILLKMNGQKKADSPSSIPDSSRHTTTASTPAAGTAQSPPFTADPQAPSRNPFRTSHTPHPAAPSPGNLKDSVSPMITNASMVQPTPARAPAAPQPPAKRVPHPIRYAAFGLPTGYDKNGMINEPVTAKDFAYARRPGTSIKDSPIQFIRFGTPPDAPRQLEKPKKFTNWNETYKSDHIVNMSATFTRVRVEAFLNPEITNETTNYGIWLTQDGHRVAYNNRAQDSQGRLVYQWDLKLKAGRINSVHVICDLLKTNPEEKEFIERAQFEITANISPV
ncbi:hypothetical protein TWF694_010909 [Orbilia ellipsospora]|uniref:Bromo domain-containing protein n=1 Tax=Orbilia ellipsospora TaxID=2528407 RepID=A0AAV9X8N3_9PEZI